MRRKLTSALSAVLACVLVLSCCPPAALAAGGMDHFKKAYSYPAGKFTDVPAGSWFAESVQTAYELGLVKGDSDTAFAPNGPITIASALALACRLHSLYNTGAADFEQGTPWYAVYVDYAVNNGIITAGQFSNYNANATRRQFAGILAKALPEEALAAMNTVEDDAIPDVPAGSEGADNIYRLYRAGILTGNDARGVFAPDSTIDRASVAAIVSRMAVPALRRSITLKVIQVESVSLNQTALTLTAGGSAALTASVSPENAVNKTISWTSSDSGVAAVDGAGKVTGVAEGSATITATASNGVTAQCAVTVNAAPIPATGISVQAGQTSLDAGDTLQLTASVLPGNANTNNTVTWSSNNNSVATVDGAGKVTAVAPGSATITARLPDGKSDTVRLTVKKASVKIILRDSLPKTLSFYNSRDVIQNTWSVTDFRYEISDYTHQVEQTAYLYFSGEKIYDVKGPGQGATCRISWQLFDAEGYVIDSGTCSSPSVREGEKFKDAKAYSFDLMPGTYYLEISSTN